MHVLAVGVAVAALFPLHVGSWSLAVRTLLAACAVAAYLGRRALPLCAAIIAFTCVHAGAAWSDAAPVDFGGSHHGPVTLVSDPEAADGGVRLRADVDGAIVDLRAWGGSAGWLRSRLMGEVVEVDVTLRPLNDPPRWIVAQGLDGRGTVKQVRGFTEGAVHTRIANSLRRTIESGARSMSRDQRALFTGLVYGDDRSQSPIMLDDFDAAGLSHLVAVSGQNVAFTLAIAGPLLRRLGHRRRWIAIALILLVFATMTRFEPSVLRASVMAGIAATGALVGTAVPATRVLTLAGVGLIVWRPMLVHSVAFQLSVAASAGILLWSARLARAIPGPRPLVEAVSVTASAQLAVAPLLLWRFGTMPVAALPANLLAGPASGAVMMWGMTAGWVAGLVPDPVATVLHWPTRLGVSWIAGVARWSAGLPLGELGWPHIVGLAAAGQLALLQVDLRRRAILVGCAVALLMVPALTSLVASPGSGELPSGSLVLRGPRVLADVSSDQIVVVPRGRPQDVLADLRRNGIDRIDLLVLERSNYAAADLVGWIEQRATVGHVWAPEATLGRGESVPDEASRWPLGQVDLVAVIEDGRLELRVG